MDQQILNSSEVFAEGIRVINRPLDTDMGIQPISPFILSVSAETGNYEDLVVGLYVSNSDSIPYTSEMDNNFSALKPQWRFLDINGDYIQENASIDFTTEIVDENGNVRGGVGTVTFYYVDDLPSPYGNPAMLEATLQLLDYYDKEYGGTGVTVKSYYNSQIKTIIPFYVYPIIPSFIHFSKNGSIDIYDRQWAGSNIKAYATIHGVPRSQFQDYNRCAIDYPILFNIPYIGGPPATTNDLNYVLHPLTGDEATPPPNGTVEFPLFSTENATYTGGFVEVNAVGWVQSDTAALSGSVRVRYDPDDYYTSTTSELWVSNKTANKVHKLQSIYLDTSNEQISGIYARDVENVSNNLINVSFDTPFYDPDDYSPVSNADILSNIHELSGQSAVYAMAIDEFSNVWYCDYELDKIYKRSSDGELLFTIDLQNNPSIIPSQYQDEYTWYGPSCITIDSDNYAYVGLYNSPSAIAITPEGDIDGFLVPDGSTYSPVSGEDERLRWAPISIEADVNGEIFVYYSSLDLNGFIMYDPDTYLEMDVKLDSGTGIGEVEMLALDVVESAYTALFVTRRDGIYRQWIYPYGTFYLDTTRVIYCDNPTYLTLDTNKNLWFAFDGNKVGYAPYAVDGVVGTNFDYITIDGNDLTDDVIGGLAGDGTGFINILDKYKNVIYRLNADEFIANGTDSTFGVKILPEANYTIYKDDAGVISKIPATPDQPIDSLYAFGDWTGIRWQHKYGATSIAQPNVAVDLYGTSNSFSIRSLEDQYDIRRFNDSWDMKSQIKSYVIPDYQKEFVDLWDDLIGNIVGDDTSEYQRFGRQIYEKIANFVLNHSDIDLANIDQVYSLFQSLGRNYNNYDFNYPADLKHWMNVLSIAYERLKGTQYQCNRNFKVDKLVDIEPCEVCGEIHASNLGDEYVGILQVGTPYVIRDTYLTSDSYDIFYPPTTISNREDLVAYGFRSPFSINYEVYEYIPTVSPNTQSQGFINWADVNNKIAISGTNVDDWWGDGGYVENTFAQLLYDGLGVGTQYTIEYSAANTYPINIVGELLSGETSVQFGMPAFQYLVPVKTVECSPLKQYALPFYYDAPVVSDKYPLIVEETLPLSAGTFSGKYIEIIFNKEKYYAPIYSIDGIVSPQVGNGPIFTGDIITPEFDLVAADWMLFDISGSDMRLPVYLPKSESVAPISAAEPFTFVHIGDTQVIVREAGEGDAGEVDRVLAMYQWIVDNKEAYNIQMVMHTGDLVDWNATNQYEMAASAVALIDDADIPMIIGPGNHDHESIGAPSLLTSFHYYFPETRYKSKDWFYSQYEDGASENVCYSIDYNGINYLFLSTTVIANNGVLAWANDIVARNPDSVVIYNTHNYLEDIGDTDADIENVMTYDTNPYGQHDWFLDNDGAIKTNPTTGINVFPWGLNTLTVWSDTGTTINGEKIYKDKNNLYRYWYSLTYGLFTTPAWVITNVADVGSTAGATPRFAPSPSPGTSPLVGSNSFTGELSASPWDTSIDKRNTGLEHWEKLVSQHYNIQMAFCGHNHDWTGLLYDTGVYGDIKVQFQNDYSKIYGGISEYAEYRDAIMLITVDPTTRTASTRVWSNTLGWITGGQQENTFRLEPITEDEL